MQTFMEIILFIASIVIIVAVLMQESKSDGVASLTGETNIAGKGGKKTKDAYLSQMKKGNDFENFDENSEVEVEIVPETLFYNMLVAEADYLYGLPQWMDILGEDKIKELTKKFKKSKTVVKGKKIGRNDPCPCGSGKKYKHCCGRN